MKPRTIRRNRERNMARQVTLPPVRNWHLNVAIFFAALGLLAVAGGITWGGYNLLIALVAGAR